jgi:4-diphosphocytidyl-2-C-methyl-D-erythritol kinase
MWKTEILSPAKINLHLDVAPPGKNGFHPLRSLFLMVSLYDKIIVEETLSGCTIESNCSFPMEENILYKTWALCCERGFYQGGLALQLDKRIPSGAGLGGGSGNCAALLRVLKEKAPGGRTDQDWLELAAELGSDVPFFMDTCSAVVTGRGETISPVESRGDFQILIVYPDLSISTPSAFRLLDEYRQVKAIKHDWGKDEAQIAHQFKEMSPLEWDFFNSFTQPIYKEYPILQSIEENLLTSGADFVKLSGSGSAMVGIYSDEKSHSKALELMKSKFPATYSVFPLEFIPYGIVI